jgi:Flp pilus assembly CpaF family ATPase
MMAHINARIARSRRQVYGAAAPQTVIVDENEAKILKPYFKAGNRLEVNITPLNTQELSISVVKFKPQPSRTSSLAKDATKSKVAGALS